MSGEQVFCARRLHPDPRLPDRPPRARRGVLVSRDRHRPDRALRGPPDRPRRRRSAPTWRGCTRATASSLVRWFGFLERWFMRLVGDRAAREQDWKSYSKTVLVFSAVFFGLLYALLRLQGHLFLNPDGLSSVSPTIAFNTAASFVTNTNWQYYGGETTMSYLSQMAGLAVQNFVSAAVAMAVLVAVIRGFSRRSTGSLGNFWQDLYRSIAYILLPALDRPRAGPRRPGRRPDLLTAMRPSRPSRARTSRSRAARPPRRSPSSSSARTAEASTTRTRQFPSRTRRLSRTSSRCCRSS